MIIDLILFKPDTVDKYELLVGNREWMAKNGLKVTKDMDVKMSEHENQGQTAVLCAVDGMFTC